MKAISHRTLGYIESTTICESLGNHSEALLIWRDKNVFARERANRRFRFVKICRENIHRIAGNPGGKVDRFINPAVESDQYPAPLAADVLELNARNPAGCKRCSQPAEARRVSYGRDRT